MSRRWKVSLVFRAEEEVSAETRDAALKAARDELFDEDGLSVYDDAEVEELVDAAYEAGAFGGDNPLRRKHAYEFRDGRFEASMEAEEVEG